MMFTLLFFLSRVLAAQRYNAVVTECSDLKGQLQSLEGKKFRGMTVSEQAMMFNEKVNLITRHDELQDELVNTKIAVAKMTWQQEHERVYRKQRNKLIYRILKRPLSVQDREQVIGMLRATEEDSMQDAFEDDAPHGAAPAGGDSTEELGHPPAAGPPDGVVTDLQAVLM